MATENIKINEDIGYTRVGIIEDGKVVEYTKEQGINKAFLEDKDLVQVGTKEDIAICKILDYSKYKYEQDKKKKKNKVNQKKVEIKEIRFTYKIADHDIETKVNSMQRILGKGNTRIKVVIEFKGREINKITEFGIGLAEHIRSFIPIEYKTSDIIQEGRNLTFMVERGDRK